MPYAEASAVQGFLLEFAFSQDLALRVVAQNNKAALFGTLESVAKIPGCEAVYWGMESANRKRIVLVAGELEATYCLPDILSAIAAGFKDGTSRSQLPLDRILPFLASPPRIFETVFPTGFEILGKPVETTIHLARHNNRIAHQSGDPSWWQLSDQREASVNSDVDDEEWVDFQTTDHWVAVDMQTSTKSNNPPVEWLETRRRTLSPANKPGPPGSRSPPAGCLVFSLVPQKYSVPSACSYYQHLNKTKILASDQSHPGIGSQQKCQTRLEEMAYEDGWVLVR